MFNYSPQRYSCAYKQNDPACLIAEGQKIVTTTLDAHGRNGKGERLVDYSNPLTGPFVIENAQPGDTLSVKIEAINPLGGKGWSYAYPRPWLLESADAALYPDKKSVEWEVDTESGFATADFLSQGRIKIPLRPMLGCIGVACKAGVEATSQQMGAFGGNLDFQLLNVGAQLELPVMMPGGYLFVGDAHAVQFAGEITGAAVEVPAEVEFSIRLNKGKVIHWPWGETQEALFTLGIGKPFEAAVQHAVSEMIYRLQREYALPPAVAAEITGPLGEIQVCSLVSDNFSAACMIPKAALSSLQIWENPQWQK